MNFCNQSFFYNMSGIEKMVPWFHKRRSNSRRRVVGELRTKGRLHQKLSDNDP